MTIIGNHAKKNVNLLWKEVYLMNVLISFAMLVDDEKLELRELQAGPNQLTCSDHLGTS